MGSHEETEADAVLRGQAHIWELMFAFADSMALKCAVELRIADIIHSHGRPITLSQLASSIKSDSSVDSTCLSRIMRLLVRKGVFTAYSPSDGGDTIYGPTHSSTWLLSDAELTLAPMLLMENHPIAMAPWHYFSDCVRKGGIAFQKAHGHEIWDFAGQNTEFNKIFNDGMACTARITTKAVMSGYKDGFRSVGSLVDVGGGTGSAISEVVKSYPHIKAINFDLPHVVSTAPQFPGVTHVGGDMFKEVPKADAIFMKWILHDWNDEDCIKILKNCRKAIPEKSGKVIIVDIVIGAGGGGDQELFDETGAVFDLVMLAHSSGGMERTEHQWKEVLAGGGFPRYRIIKIAALPSIIEAYPM